ncbi:MAG: hypothetical protein HY843_02785, partial [Bdellovibrio sp.]|nr:hypothetical protein [Bdellovibrio sp.]
EKDRTSEIELKILETSDIIPVGASADIEVIIEQKLSVLAIPTRTILGRGDSRYVYCYKNGQINKTPIKTGIGNYDRTEILFGVNENDTVIFPPEDIELKDKMSAKIELKQWP